MSGAKGPLQGELFDECASWVWEQLQDDGIVLAGELIELIMKTERELRVQGDPLPSIANTLESEFGARGIVGNPGPISARLILSVLEWEDEFLGLAGIPRAES